MLACISMLSRLQRLNTRDLSSKITFGEKTLLLVRTPRAIRVAMNDEQDTIGDKEVADGGGSNEPA